MIIEPIQEEIKEEQKEYEDDTFLLSAKEFSLDQAKPDLEQPLLGNSNIFTLSQYKGQERRSSNVEGEFNYSRPYRKVGRFAMVDYEGQQIFVH